MLLTINSCCGERLSGNINRQRGPRRGASTAVVTAPVLATNLGSSSLGIHQPETAGTTGTLYNEQLKAKTFLTLPRGLTKTLTPLFFCAMRKIWTSVLINPVPPTTQSVHPDSNSEH